jgi:amino acid permease
MSVCDIDYPMLIQVIFALTALLGIYLGFRNRITKESENGASKTTKKGIGKRFIQFVALMLIVPAIVILSMQGIMDKQLMGGLLGTIVGYTLSDLFKDSKEDEK